VRTGNLNSVLLSTLMITSIMALAIPLLSTGMVHADLTSHAPISINGNAGFTKPDPVNGGGSGTVSDPYIIENWDINAEGNNPIEIDYTTAYFIIRNCHLYNGGEWGCGFNFGNVINGKVDNNIVENCRVGILLRESSSNNTVSNNIAENNSIQGIEINSSDNNLINNNTCENNPTGILIHNYSDNNLISGNTVRNNYYGIRLIIELGNSDNNRIFHNNLVNNQHQAEDYCSNFWDDGYPSGGNYWSDYTGDDYYSGENQDIPGSDRIGDTPYPIPGGSNLDRYPLTTAYIVSAVFKLENLYKVSLEKDLWLYTGAMLVVEFYNYDNNFQAISLIEIITPPQRVVENENVPHPRGAEGYPWGTVQIARLILMEYTGEPISIIASLTVHQSHLRDRDKAILKDWGGHPELWSAFRNEDKDILTQWSSAPP